MIDTWRFGFGLRRSGVQPGFQECVPYALKLAFQTVIKHRNKLFKLQHLTQQHTYFKSYLQWTDVHN